MSNKEVASLEIVVKSDSSVEQIMYFFNGSKEKSKTSIKGRLFEGYIGLMGDSMVYFVRVDDCWEGVWIIKWTISYYFAVSPFLQ